MQTILQKNVMQTILQKNVMQTTFCNFF